MHCVSALSTAPEGESALSEVLDRLTEGLGGDSADLAVAFASIHHVETLERLGNEVMKRGLTRRVLGCTGESIVGDGREVEGEPALVAWAARVPGAVIRPVRIDDSDDGLAALGPNSSGSRTLLLLGDPFTFASDPWLKRADAVGGLRVLGGMASASSTPGGNRLILDGQSFGRGAVGLLIEGVPGVRSVVSQGCRPIGRPLIVTRAERNVIHELGRRPALEVLREIFEDLTPDDQERAQSGLHIGRVINEYQDRFGRGDFLVRNILGADDAGGIATTELLRVGQTVQFHVRDAETADEDLRSLIDAHRSDRPGTRAAGALLFSCNGRGTRLFDEPNHDARVLRERLGPIPVAGFFAMGELGPVGDRNFIHGYTASIVLFEDDEG